MTIRLPRRRLLATTAASAAFPLVAIRTRPANAAEFSYKYANNSPVNHPLNIGAAKRRAIIITAKLCQHHIGDLVDKLFVIAVLLHFVATHLVISACPHRIYCRSIASILPTRFLCRSSEISVEINASTISLSCSKLFWPAPSVRTLAPLCSREFLAMATE